MAETMTKQKQWLKPSEIVEQGLILNTKAKPDIKFVLRLIKNGQLKARTYATAYYENLDQTREYYQVHIDEIKRYNAGE